MERRMEAELLELTRDGYVVMGTITLEGDMIQVSSDKPNVEKSVLEIPANIDGKRVYAKDNPEAWFKALPRTFSGSYMRARILSIGDDIQAEEA